MKNKQKGITLVALVITIIILLILAGISIVSLTKSGLFSKTQEAKQKQENTRLKEDAILADYEKKINTYLNNSREEITIDKEEYESLKTSVAQNQETIKTLQSKVQQLENANNSSNTTEISDNLLASSKEWTLTNPGSAWTIINETITLKESIKNYDEIYFDCDHCDASGNYARRFQKNYLVNTMSYSGSETETGASSLMIYCSCISGGNTALVYGVTGKFKDDMNFIVSNIGSNNSSVTKFRLIGIYGIKY